MVRSYWVGNFALITFASCGEISLVWISPKSNCLLKKKSVPKFQRNNLYSLNNYKLCNVVRWGEFSETIWTGSLFFNRISKKCSFFCKLHFLSNPHDFENVSKIYYVWTDFFKGSKTFLTLLNINTKNVQLNIFHFDFSKCKLYLYRNFCLRKFTL